MSKTIVVTGGSGYIGRVVCKMLVMLKYNVINIDRNSQKMEGVTTFNYDIANSSEVRGILKLAKPEAIIHLAATPSAPKSVVNPSDTYQNNVANTINLMHHAVEFGVKHFVFSSSSSVYGGKDGATSEDEVTDPKSPYGNSKLMIEEVLADFSAAYDFSYVAFRYFNAAGTYGELGYQKDPMEHVLPIISDKAVKNEEFTIFGDDYDTNDGTCERDYTHVADIARGHLLALDHLFAGKDSEIFNLGSGNPASIYDLIKMTEKEIDGKIKVKRGPARAGDPARTHANITKADKILNWNPENNIEDIVREEVQWARDHNK
jgi:UDP-glucose 4-epimerase